MSLIIPTDRSLYHAAYDGTKVWAAGITQVGDATGSGMQLINSPDENEFLQLTLNKAGTYSPLPAVGEWIEAGEIYAHDKGLVIVRQSHSRMDYPVKDTPALFSVYREDAASLSWVANEKVEIGLRRTFDDVLYECIQAHTTQEDWSPPDTPALWKKVQENPGTNEWQAWTAYVIKDRVTYKELLYECRQSHTSQPGWEPPNVLALWLPIEGTTLNT